MIFQTQMPKYSKKQHSNRLLVLSLALWISGIGFFVYAQMGLKNLRTTLPDPNGISTIPLETQTIEPPSQQKTTTLTLTLLPDTTPPDAPSIKEVVSTDNANLYTVKIHSEKRATIMVNSNPVGTADEEGKFEAGLYLETGENIFDLAAIDYFGNHSIIQQVILKREPRIDDPEHFEVKQYIPVRYPNIILPITTISIENNSSGTDSSGPLASYPVATYPSATTYQGLYLPAESKIWADIIAPVGTYVPGGAYAPTGEYLPEKTTLNYNAYFPKDTYLPGGAYFPTNPWIITPEILTPAIKEEPSTIHILPTEVKKGPRGDKPKQIKTATPEALDIIDFDVILPDDYILEDDLLLNELLKLSEELHLLTEMILSVELTLQKALELAEDITLGGEIALTKEMTLKSALRLEKEVAVPASRWRMLQKKKTRLERSLSFLYANILSKENEKGEMTILEQGTILPEGTVLPAGTILPEGTTLPKGTVLPEGTTLPQGTVLPKGMTLPEGTILPKGFKIPKGNKIKKGTKLAAGTPLSQNTIEDITEIINEDLIKQPIYSAAPEAPTQNSIKSPPWPNPKPSTRAPTQPEEKTYPAIPTPPGVEPLNEVEIQEILKSKERLPEFIADSDDEQKLSWLKLNEPIIRWSILFGIVILLAYKNFHKKSV